VNGSSRGVVFLDRDGTINHDSGYIGDPDEMVLIDGAAKAVKRLNDEGVTVVVVTNQSGIGRGYYREADFEAVNARLYELLAREQARIDALYFCPHTPGQGCGCRKPATGLVDRAARELGIDPSLSYLVGDKAADMGLARAVGATDVLVMTGYGEETAAGLDPPPAHVARDLSAAVDWIIDEMRRRRG